MRWPEGSHAWLTPLSTCRGWPPSAGMMKILSTVSNVIHRPPEYRTRIISHPGQKTSLPSQRWNQPDIAAIGAKSRIGCAHLHHRAARRASRYKCDPVPVRREGGFNILAGIIGDVDFLSAIHPAHVNLIVSAAVRGEGEHGSVRRPCRRPGIVRIMRESHYAG